MPATRQSSWSSSTSKRPTRKVAGGVNYSDDLPEKVECMDVKKNLGDAWSTMGKLSNTMVNKNKGVGIRLGENGENFRIGNKKTTLVKKIEPAVITLADDKVVKPSIQSQLPTSLRITKLEDTPKSAKVPARPGKVNEVWVSQQSGLPTQSKKVATNRGTPVHHKAVVYPKVQIPIRPKPALPGLESISIRKVDEITTADENSRTTSKSESENSLELNTQVSFITTPPKQNPGLISATTPSSNGLTSTKSPRDGRNRSTPSVTKVLPKSFSTPVLKPNLTSPAVSKSSGRVVKKPSIINSQKKAIVKTIKKLNQDQKKRIEERLGDIGSNLQKIKHEEEIAKDITPEPIVEKRPLKEVLSDGNWLEMFLLTEPTARYNPIKDTLYCHTCKDMSDDDVDGWVKGNPKGEAWLKYREHKLGEEHQKTSTKYFLQLFIAQRDH